jgi:AraC-like DNA-binding protein
MIENYNLILLSGGHHYCDKSWSRKAKGTDRCWKVYFPVAGAASLQMGSDSFTLQAGQVYLISGFRLTRQHCPEAMEVFWIHFVPESLYLHHLLDQAPPVFHCPRPDTWSVEKLRDLCEIFQNPFSDENRPFKDSSPVADCRVHGMLLTLISQALETLAEVDAPAFQPEWQRLKPAVDFMQLHFHQNPALADIAARVGMAPNHFHRRFANLFGKTPFEHMLAQRMDRARHLLASTALTVKEVSAQVGYEDAAYFSRVFTKRFGITPSDYRSKFLWHDR